MIAVVRLFAGARELAGVASVSLELPVGSTVAELRERLTQQILLPSPGFAGEGPGVRGFPEQDPHPNPLPQSREREPESALASLLRRSRIAVDCEFADDSAVVPDGAELALIPPVSGGSA